MINLELLTMPGCSHCAAAKRTIEKVKIDFLEMDVKIIDTTEYPEVAAKYMLMSAPGVVINGNLEFSGGVNEEELRKKLEGLQGE